MRIGHALGRPDRIALDKGSDDLRTACEGKLVHGHAPYGVICTLIVITIHQKILLCMSFVGTTWLDDRDGRP